MKLLYIQKVVDSQEDLTPPASLDLLITPTRPGSTTSTSLDVSGAAVSKKRKGQVFFREEL